MISCSWKDSVGIECPTCGFQRSVDLLFEGDILGSLSMFPATIPLVVTFVILVLHLIFQFKNGAYILIGTFSLSVLLIIVHYVARVVDGSVFV